MSRKTQQLQIRVTAREKAALKRRARAAGRDLSSYVLARLLGDDAGRFAGILAGMGKAADHRYALAELNDFLAGLSPLEFADAVANADLDGLSPDLRNYVAAMVEQAAHARELDPPAWVQGIAPLASPWFVTPLASLRMHLLTAAPVPFRRRNIFVDAGVGARV